MIDAISSILTMYGMHKSKTDILMHHIAPIIKLHSFVASPVYCAVIV